MISKLIKPTVSAIRALPFVTSKITGIYSMKMNNTGGMELEGFVTKDAERIFDKFFKENPPKESERSFFGMDTLN
jgi:hypothetical protein